MSFLMRSDELSSLDTSSGSGDSAGGGSEPTSAFFRLPNPQLLARFANVLAAVRAGLAGACVVFCVVLLPASGDGRGT